MYCDRAIVFSSMNGIQRGEETCIVYHYSFKHTIILP
jgi:hypothetical protein